MDHDNILRGHGGHVQGNDVERDEASGLIFGGDWQKEVVDGRDRAGPDLAKHALLIAIDGTEARRIGGRGENGD